MRLGYLWAALLFAPLLHAGDKVSAQQFVDLQQGDSVHPGFRRAHAKGICVQGEFRNNGALAQYSSAQIFATSVTPFVGRFSLAGNNPTAPDLKAPVRSLALSFATSASEQWRIAMNTPPVMAVSNPQDFYQQLVAIKSGPKAIQAFFAEHPESADFLAWKDSYQPSGSFAAETYHSINAFYLVDDNEQRQPVRWHMQPTVSVTDDGLSGPNALHQELKARLAKQPVVFDWLFTLASAQDDERNPAIQWPAERPRINAGKIVITQWQAQQDGACHSINFDPLVLPSGISPTADAILRARSAAYAESYRRRAVEQLRGQAKELSND
ncbi:catalase [Pseudoalteromonas sp. SW0106-04]|uniref:catalase family peroxidase n=1 Tax=Pseudoalteromonas sp. SW0106-04 TaxID=1702169 RepID=UPI0006B6064E|nr:catalase family peroxidase [Pseudoalteromonas sp. SW0106-04]GAP73729.1 catalase [Pseudoalteromonas sp. SW0106-04]